MTVLNSLIRSRKFWLSVIAVIQTMVFSLMPNLPDEIWQAINVILLWLVGMIAAEDAATKFRGVRSGFRLDQ